MASAFPSCDICQSRGSHKEADTWCSECDELLCSECTEHHSISKSSKHHRTLPVDDYRNLPVFVLNVKNQCDLHNSKYNFYCPIHDEPLCDQCFHIKHKNCDRVSSLADMVKDVKQSNMMSYLDSNIHELAYNNKTLITKCRESIDVLTISMEKCHTEVREIRETAEKHFRKIEQEILEEISIEYTKCLDTKLSLLKSLQETETRITTAAKDMIKIRDHASETQTFLATRYMDNQLQEHKSYIASVIDKNEVNCTECTFTISPSIFYITNDFCLLGDFSLSNKSMDLSYETLKGKEAQLVQPYGVHIFQYEIQKHRQIYLPTGKNPFRVTGCAVSPRSEIVMADKNNDRLLIYDAKDTLIKEFKIIGNPVDVAYTKTNKVAVSLANKPKLKFVNIDNGGTLHKLPLTCNGYGVSTAGNCVVVRVKNSSFLVTDKTGKHKQSVPVQGDCILYVSYHDEKFYYTKWDVDKVICCDDSGNIIWEFQNNVLHKPCGISVDNNGNVFVAGFYSNNVVLISENGKNFRELLTEKDDVHEPVAIDYDSESKQLVVVNLNDGVCNIFDVNIKAL